MSVTISSTTDSPEEITRALEAAGQTVESVETIDNEPVKPADKPKTEDKPAPAEKPASKEAGKPGEGTTADESETSEEAEETEEQEAKPKKGGGAEKKIDRLTREKAELAESNAKGEGRIEELTRQIAELRDLLPKPGDEGKKPAAEEKKPEDAKPAEAKPKPVLEDFDSHELWLDALTDWKIEQREAKEASKVNKLEEELAKLRGDLTASEQKSAAQVEHEARLVAFQERNAETVKAYGDWDAVMAKPETKDVKVSELLTDLIWDHDGGADVLRYLVDHPDEAAAVFKLTTVAKDATPKDQTRAVQLAGIEFSRIRSVAVAARTAKTEAQAAEDAGEAPAGDKKPGDKKPAEVTPPKPKQQASKAPPPIKPNSGTAPPSAATPYEKTDMSHKEYIEWHRRTHPNKYPRSA